MNQYTYPDVKLPTLCVMRRLDGLTGSFDGILWRANSVHEPTHRLDRWQVPVHEDISQVEVVRAHKEQAIAWVAVSSCTTDLLTIALDAGRYVKVNHIAYVCFVYAHAECDCSTYDHVVAMEKFLLDSSLVLHCLASVEVDCIEALLSEIICKFFGLLLHCRVDHGRARVLPQEVEQ